jgi:nicotinate-nucleotide adenylyltransferase
VTLVASIRLNLYTATFTAQVVIIRLGVVRERHLKTKRIGIYSGTFDPVHSGHVAFALQAMKDARLDLIYFLPERRPRHKQGVAHFAHRIAMLKYAARPYRNFKVMELTDISFRREFSGHQLVFLFGSDVVPGLIEWPKADLMLKECELVIGLRNNCSEQTIKNQIASWPTQPKDVTIFTSYAPDISSGKVRDALRRRTYVQGLLASVRRYSDLNWLYVSLA